MLRAALLLATLASSPLAMSDTLKNEFAPTGTLRVAVNFGNIVIAQKDPGGGAPRGVGPELARELARRLGVPVSYVVYDNAGKVADAVKNDAWDIAFLAVDPKRANEIGFSAPYVLIEGTYLVREDSPLRRVADFDKPGIRITVGKNTAYDLYLQRELKHAARTQADTSEAAVRTFIADRQFDAAAGVRDYLLSVARKNPGLRVADDSYMTIGQAAGVPKGRANAVRYLGEFIEEMKASGFVARTLAATGLGDVKVAPPAP